MTDFAAAAERLISLYNAKDLAAMKPLISPDLDFAHFNRDFAFQKRDDLFNVLTQFAEVLAPDRHFLEPERVTAAGNVVVREAYWSGTAQVDLPGFANAGGTFRLKFCTVMRFDDNGILVEWKDHG